MNDHEYAVSALDNQAKIVENNAKINRREGDTAQAELEEHSAVDFREAIKVLKKRQKVPQITPK